MQLYWLSLTGQALVESEAGDYGFNNTSGGVGRRLYLEVGISQKSDSAINYAYTGALMSHNERIYQHEGPFDFGLRVAFPTLVDLPPDTGIIADMQSNFNESVQGGTYYVWNPGLLINGFFEGPEGSRRPSQLAGFVASDNVVPITAGTKVGIHNADLFNDGKETIKMHEMVLTTSQLIYAETAGTVFSAPELERVSWRVNPTSGPEWMPQSEPIPAGNIAPFNRGANDLTDRGPKAYVFPDGIRLNPRQRVGIKVGNLSSTKTQTFDLCLFGLMEVE
jgi:hypothetical protein